MCHKTKKQLVRALGFLVHWFTQKDRFVDSLAKAHWAQRFIPFDIINNKTSVKPLCHMHITLLVS